MTDYTLNIECVSVAYDIFLKVESVNRISIIIVCRANNKRCYYEARSRKCDCYYEICAFQLAHRSIVMMDKLNIV